MAISKSAKIEAEIEKVKAKISEQQARLKELEQKKVEAENSEIVDIVRGRGHRAGHEHPSCRAARGAPADPGRGHLGTKCPEVRNRG